jgi:hypothetical protein
MIRRPLLFVCLAVCIVPAVAFTQSQETDRPTVVVGMLSDGQQPTIDGRVDEDSWNGAPPYTAFIQQEPDEGQPASERTEVRFLADKKNVRGEDEPAFRFLINSGGWAGDHELILLPQALHTQTQAISGS